MTERILMGPGGATEAKQDAEIAAIQEPLTLGEDSVRQTARPMKPFHTSLSAGEDDGILVTAPDRIRVLRIDGGCKPSTSQGIFPTYAINLDVGSGDEVVRGKELQAGEPIGCTVCLEGVAGADLTVSVTGLGGMVEFDIYYEIFQ